MSTPDQNLYLGRRLDWVRCVLARRQPQYRFKWDVYFERLEILARTATRFLDAGCADNKTASELAGPSLCAGIDLTTGPASGVHVAGHLERLPFRGGSFDLIGCRHVVEHLEDPSAVFAELRRVMTPGGRLLIQTVNRTSPLVWCSRRLGDTLRRRLLHQRYKRRSFAHSPLHDRFNIPSAFMSLPEGFRLVSLEMIQDVDLQSRLGFWLTYLLVLWTKDRPGRRSTITAEWERL